MKTKVLLRFIPQLLMILICISQNSLGQGTKLDSLICEKNLKVTDGTIQMYCAVQCENRAKEAQSLLQKLVETYSNDGKNAFKLKLAVIDSSQWFGFGVPYGFFFISQGWIVIPGDLDFQRFSNLWGFSQFSDVVKNKLDKLSSNPEELLTNMLYNFVICHELGHYYTRNILNAFTPDRWTSELMASYFATDFLYKYDERIARAYSVFTSTFAEEYVPRYRTLTDFNLKYASVGLENFVWYHCMFQPMIEDIYSQYKYEFLDLFERTFPGTGAPEEYTQEVLLNKMDNITDGKASKWIGIMEGTTE